MNQHTTSIEVHTNGRQTKEITAAVNTWVRRTGISTGLLTVFIQHTSASLIITENADPDVQRDLVAHFNRAVPDNHPSYIHTAEGPDDMPSHIKCAMTSSNLSIPVVNGSTALGTWQGIFVFEHRDRAHTRRVVLHLIGE